MIRLILESKSALTSHKNLTKEETKDLNQAAKEDVDGEEEESKVTVSQMYLVDLAGSENVKKSGVEGKYSSEESVHREWSTIAVVVVFYLA